MSNDKSRTDWKRIDNMRDADIVYDEDTGAPLSAADLAAAKRDGFVANGLADFRDRMKLAAR